MYRKQFMDKLEQLHTYLSNFGHVLREKEKILLLFILVLALIVRAVPAFTNPFMGTWDEVFHGVVARNLCEHMLKPTLFDDPVCEADNTNWTSAHIWLHKPPLMLWLMALSLKLFGFYSWALRIPSIILSTLSVYLVYLIFSRLFSPVFALVLSALMAFNSFLIEIASGREPVDHMDTGLFFFILLSIFLILKVEQSRITIGIPIGVSIGLAFLTKSFVGLFPILLLPLFIIRMGMKKFVSTCLISMFFFMMTVLPWNVYIFVMWPQEYRFESEYSLRHINEVLEGHEHPWFYYFSPEVLQHYYVMGGPFFVFMYLGIIALIHRIYSKPRFEHVLILFWFMVPLILFSIFKTKMLSYCFFTVPAGLCMVLLLLKDVSGRLAELLWTKDGKRVTALVYTTFLILLLLFPARIISWELSKQFSGRYERPAGDLTYYDHDDLMNKLSSIATSHDKTVFFNIEFPYHLLFMFKIGFSAYDHLPKTRELFEIVKRDYSVVVVNPTEETHHRLEQHELSGKLTFLNIER